MICAGIDYSMSSPSITIYDTDKELTFENLTFYNLCGTKSRAGYYNGNIVIQNFPEYETQEQRFRNIATWAEKILVSHGVTSLAIEGYALGSGAGRVFQIAENTSVLKQKLDLNGISFITPAPTQVKKNFTGSGKAKKEGMIDEFYRRFPEVKFHELINVKEYAKPLDDIIDSYAIMLMHPHFKE